jgi:hypothetical protein
MLPQPTPQPIGPQQPVAMIATNAVIKLANSFIERIMGLSQPSANLKRRPTLVCISVKLDWESAREQCPLSSGYCMPGAGVSVNCCRPAKVFGASTNRKIIKLYRVLLAIRPPRPTKTQMMIVVGDRITDSNFVE